MSDALESWHDFNVAMAGATAALAGLVIVAASVNIGKFIHTGSLTSRLGASIASLTLALVAATVGLMPDVTLRWYGAVLIAGTLVSGAFQCQSARMVLRDSVPGRAGRIAKSTIGFVSVVAYLVAGGLLIGGRPAGLPVTAAGSLAVVIVALTVSWIALVEVLR